MCEMRVKHRYLAAVAAKTCSTQQDQSSETFRSESGEPPSISDVRLVKVQPKPHGRPDDALGPPMVRKSSQHSCFVPVDCLTDM